MSHDALVVGSGPNGLAAAITLARAGRRVLVLEAAARAGGAVATEELTLPGFRHDTFSSVYPAGAASPVFARMPLERHGLRWIHPAACLAHPLPDGSAVALYRDLDRTAASLDARPPGRRRALARFRRAVPASLRRAARDDARRLPAGRGLAAAGRRASVRGACSASRGCCSTPRRRSASGCSRARARARGCTARRCTPTCRPPARGSAIAAAYMNLLGHGAGWPSPEGGAGRLADALLSYLRELGGEVRTGAASRASPPSADASSASSSRTASGSPRRS